jgi:hypothetical protein
MPEETLDAELDRKAIGGSGQRGPCTSILLQALESEDFAR